MFYEYGPRSFSKKALSLSAYLEHAWFSIEGSIHGSILKLELWVVVPRDPHFERPTGKTDKQVHIWNTKMTYTVYAIYFAYRYFRCFGLFSKLCEG